MIVLKTEKRKRKIMSESGGIAEKRHLEAYEEKPKEKILFYCYCEYFDDW